jgi:hypothetical protein
MLEPRLERYKSGAAREILFSCFCAKINWFGSFANPPHRPASAAVAACQHCFVVKIGHEHRRKRACSEQRTASRDRNLLIVRSLHTSLPRTMRRVVVSRATPNSAPNFEIILRKYVKFSNINLCRTTALVVPIGV